jgi:hypothetical protein
MDEQAFLQGERAQREVTHRIPMGIGIQLGANPAC